MSYFYRGVVFKLVYFLLKVDLTGKYFQQQQKKTVSVSSRGGEAPERGRQAFSLLCQYETGVHKLSLLGLAI